MASELGAGEDGSCSELAKPLYLQYLEKALRLDQFLRQTSAIFNRSISRYQNLFCWEYQGKTNISITLFLDNTILRVR